MAQQMMKGRLKKKMLVNKKVNFKSDNNWVSWKLSSSCYCFRCQGVKYEPQESPERKIISWNFISIVKTSFASHFNDWMTPYTRSKRSIYIIISCNSCNNPWEEAIVLSTYKTNDPCSDSIIVQEHTISTDPKTQDRQSKSRPSDFWIP